MSRSAVLLAILVAVIALGCPEVPPPAAPPAPPAAEPVVWKMSKNGLGFRLSDADAREDRPPTRVQATPLSDHEVKRVLDRLSPLAHEPDAPSFALRDRSQPPPRAGKTIPTPFPPPRPPDAAPVLGAGGPLVVTRKAPVGPVDLAPFLSVSFSAPMVAVSSHDDLAPAPVKLTPTPPGKWRWVGAQTAVFDPDKRFPMATEYVVEVPEGIRAANGQTLPKADRWSFVTPPVKLLATYPSGGPQGLDPVLFAELDQAIDRDALLSTMELRAGTTKLPVRAATEDELDTDPVVRRMADKAQAGRFVVFKAKAPLARGTTYDIVFPAGTPSAEGPRRTDKEQRRSFRTYDPLAVTKLSCSYGACPPGAPFHVRVNNTIDAARSPKGADLIRVSPEVEGLRVHVDGDAIEIHGRTRGKTRYTVTVARALTDAFGQTLGADVTREIKVDPAAPQLFPEEDRMSVLDPAAGPVLPVFSVNRPVLNVKLYAVEPDDWPTYVAWREAWDHEQKGSKTPPGRLLAARVVRPRKAPDELVVTPIELTPALVDGLGQVLVVVEPPGPLSRSRWERQWLRTWVQVTKLGVHAFSDDDSMVAWTTLLADGSPVSGVEVSLLPYATPGRGASQAPTLPPKTTGVSSADGLARLGLTGADHGVVIARKGADMTLLPDTTVNVHKIVRPDGLRWFVFDDRGVYKPGEEVHVKGWLRRIGYARGGDVEAAPGAAGRTVAWRLTDAHGVEIGEGSAVVDAGGGFDLAHKLPGTANLGRAVLTLDLSGTNGVPEAQHPHAFSIEELRRPEFEVSARAGEGPLFVGGHTNVTASASYYAGGGLPNAEARWTVTRKTATFMPPNRSDYVFGRAQERWWVDRSDKREPPAETWTGRTGPSGEHRLRLDFDALERPYPMSVSCDVSIRDVNRQAWSASTQLLVHPAGVYVGIKQDRAFVKAGEALSVDVLVTDLDGKVVPGRPVTVKSARVDWEYQQGKYVEVAADEDTCTVTSLADPARCSLKTKQRGRYQITAVVTDTYDRRNRSETHVWVIGADAIPDSGLPRDEVKVIPAKDRCQGGETAELLLVAPFAPAEGLLVIARQGILQVERFHLASATETIHFKVDPAWVPNVYADVVLIGKALREDAHGEVDPELPPRPAYATGSVAVEIPPRDRVLDVEVKPRAEELEPGGSTDIDLDVRDALGMGVASTVAVVVVDEAVLALSAYTTPDPIAEFYRAREAQTTAGGTLERMLLARPEDKEVTAAAIHVPMDNARINLDGAGGPPMGTSPRVFSAAPPERRKVITLAEVTLQGPPERIAVRKELGAPALFAPAVQTDASGHAAVSVKLPDSLTRYRVMAVAAAGERQFGSGEASITARLPLMVRPSAPRFLNYGDRFELPVVLQNQTDEPLDVDMAARAANASLTDGAGRRVKVPANDRVEVRLPAAAARPGKARFQIGAVGGRWGDAAEVSLPVWTPATTEAFATYGTVDEGAVAQPVKMPQAVEQSFGGVEITTSSTALSALSDALLYLVRYPYECNEQLASRVLSTAALRDVLGAFAAQGLPPKEVLLASMEADLKKLAARQRDDGGWSFWPSGRETWPYLTAHVAHALARAKARGYEVPKHTLSQALVYLRAIDRHIPSYSSGESRRAIVAYALYARHRLGDPDPGRARRLVAEAGGVDELSMEALGWIWPTLSADPNAEGLVHEIRRQVQDRVSETAGAAHFTDTYSDGAYLLLHADRRADGILLEALIGDQPRSDLIPKLVAGLLAHREAGRWRSTQENAFVLPALERYFDTYEKATPDFVARAWLGDRYAGEHAFKGRSPDRQQIDIPMRALAEVGSGDVVLSKTGTGRLYYRVGMTYAPSDLRPPPSEHGFTVTRDYEAVDDPGDVRRAPDGTWHVKAGSKVRVRVSMVAPARRCHVALTDALPAGLEVMNPALAVTGAAPQDPKADPGMGWWWHRTWYEHQNLRDERVEAFASLLWEGVYAYTYVAVATTPGSFVVPPPKAEEMYNPETFGRGAGDRMVVE